MTDQASRRAITRHGEDLTIRNHTHGTEDDYGDAETVETAASPHAAWGRIEAARQPEDTRGVSGTSLTYDVTVYLRDDADGLGELNGVGADDPPSTIERGATGETYRVVRVHDQGNGVVAADAQVNQ